MDQYPELPPPPFGGEPRRRGHPPEQPGRSTAVAVAVILGFLVVLGGLIVAGYSWLNAPGRCDASTVESARFGYCVEAPGWELTNAAAEVELPYDELIKAGGRVDSPDRRRPARVGSGLDEVVQAARDQSNEDGVEVGDVVERRSRGPGRAVGPRPGQRRGRSPGARDRVRPRRCRVVGPALGRLRSVRHGQEFEDILRTWTFRWSSVLRPDDTCR